MNEEDIFPAAAVVQLLAHTCTQTHLYKATEEKGFERVSNLECAIAINSNDILSDYHNSNFRTFTPKDVQHR